MIKYKWKVAPAPTGPYRSFDVRGWPSAELEDGTALALLSCEDDYVPRIVKTGQHKPLTMRIRARSTKTPDKWVWLKFTNTFPTLQAAKDAFKTYLENHPDHDFLLSE